MTLTMSVMLPKFRNIYLYKLPICQFAVTERLKIPFNKKHELNYNKHFLVTYADQF